MPYAVSLGSPSAVCSSGAPQHRHLRRASGSALLQAATQLHVSTYLAGKECTASPNCAPNALVPSLRGGSPEPRAWLRAKAPALCRRRGALWLPALLCASCQAGACFNLRLIPLGRQRSLVFCADTSSGTQARSKIVQVRLHTSLSAAWFSARVSVTLCAALPCLLDLQQEDDLLPLSLCPDPRRRLCSAAVTLGSTSLQRWPRFLRGLTGKKS